MASRFRDSKCLCFIRTIEDLEDQLEEKKAQRFIDINSGKIDDEAQMLLKSFKEDKLTKKLTKRNVFRFSVKWCPELGIDVRFHEAYLKSFCDIFFKRMLELIDQSQETSEAFEKNELMIEIIQHLNMRKSWCALFKGRDDVVSQIRKYIQASGQASQPFIIYGESGSGKTAVIAQCSRLTSSWIRGKTPAVITRFLGRLIFFSIEYTYQNKVRLNKWLLIDILMTICQREHTSSDYYCTHEFIIMVHIFTLSQSNWIIQAKVIVFHEITSTLLFDTYVNRKPLSRK